MLSRLDGALLRRDDFGLLELLGHAERRRARLLDLLLNPRRSKCRSGICALLLRPPGFVHDFEPSPEIFHRDLPPVALQSVASVLRFRRLPLPVLPSQLIDAIVQLHLQPVVMVEIVVHIVEGDLVPLLFGQFLLEGDHLVVQGVQLVLQAYPGVRDDEALREWAVLLVIRARTTDFSRASTACIPPWLLALS